MPSFTIHHLELSQLSCERVVYTQCPHFLSILFTLGFPSDNLSSPLKLPCWLFLSRSYFYSFSLYIPVNYFQHFQTSVPLHILSPLPRTSFSFFCIFILRHVSLRQRSAFSLHGAFASATRMSFVSFLFLCHPLLPFAFLCTLHIILHLIPTTTVWGKYHYPNYTDAKTEAQIH